MARFGFLSTYPPTRCGLATFTYALAGAMVADSHNEAVIVRVDDRVPAGPVVPRPGVSLAGNLRPGDLADRSASIEQLNACDLVIVQHEYGIYGGPDGEEVVSVLAGVLPPKVVVLHTVLAEPSPHQRVVLQQIIDLADFIVVMTRKAEALVASDYDLTEGQLLMIPHGADPHPAPVAAATDGRPVILTWGLIGPGKGIEWGIRAMALLEPGVQRPLYKVLGQTHPKVLMEHGDQYRLALESLVQELGVDADVEIDGRYQEAEQLAAEIAAADLVLLPYDSREQATSGVLAEAVAAGKVVIATPFPHAVELLSRGGGVLVDHQRPSEIAAAIRATLAEPVRTSAVASLAHGTARTNSWPNTARRYQGLLGAVVGARSA